MSDFFTIKTDLLLNGELYEDNAFPCLRRSIFFKPEDQDEELLNRVAWKRPKEIVKEPRFIVEGASKSDFCQGKLGDCWFLAAAATLATRNLLRRVVPHDQTFEDDEYAGIFHFNFWRYGQWKEVFVDDRLPVDSETNDMLFVCNKRQKDEFWAALLEKAYAKLHGSYQALSGGLPHDALVDFTGGISEFIYPIPQADDQRVALFARLLRLQRMHTLMAAGVFVHKGEEREARLESGIVTGHAYSVTRVMKTKIKGTYVALICLRNPWGKKEWNGPWCDDSSEWMALSADEKKTFNLIKDDDGEFWMSFKDFIENFDMLDICHMGIEDETDRVTKKSWYMTSYHGAWVEGVSAGGCRVTEDTALPQDDETDTYWSNPQYVLNVTDPDLEDDDKKATLVVSLIQKYGRKWRTVLELDRSLDNYMGFDLLKFHREDAMELLSGSAKDVADRVESIQRKAPRPHRESSAVYRVTPGVYCVIVSYGLPGHNGEYLLRFATENKVTSAEIDTPTQASLMLSQKGNLFNRLFKQHCGGDESLDAEECQHLLNDGLMKGDDVITKETCRILISTKKTFKPGRLDYDEAEQQWELVKELMTSFEEFDKNSSGHINTSELIKGLESIGVKLSRKVARAVAFRYGGKFAQVGVDDFIQCAVKLSQLCDVYKDLVVKPSAGVGHGTPYISLEEWLETTLML